MWQKIGVSSVSMSLLALSACQPSPPTPPSAIASPTPTVFATPAMQPSVMAATSTTDKYQEALNTAAAARSISESAISREDWSLVAEHWQESVKMLQSIPQSSINYRFALKILPQYRQNLNYARQKSNNFRARKPPSEPVGLIPTDNANSFSIPIIKKLDNIPVVAVTFNGQHRFEMLLDTGASRTLITRAMATQMNLQSQGKTQAKTASGISEFDIVNLDSVQFGQGVTNNITVSVGKDDLNYGLLGHDVYKGYDITLKENVIVFNRR
jgi:predicted aspartyl protease